jgi:hypothetical protein
VVERGKKIENVESKGKKIRGKRETEKVLQKRKNEIFGTFIHLLERNVERGGGKKKNWTYL